MSIFRRGRDEQQPRHGKARGTDPDELDGDQPFDVEAFDDDGQFDAAYEQDAAGISGDRQAAAARDGGQTSAGPYDSTEVAGLEGRLDLGSLWIAGMPGMELRLEVDEEAQQVVGATAVLNESAVQLQAFAAPKTMGIWDDIRSEIAQSIATSGGTAEEVEGVFGTELRTRMPSAGPDGRTVFAPARFVGVDGPRWFLRGVFSGRAAIDDAAAAPLMDVLRSTVVVRGDAPMAPRELLTLQLPKEAQSDTPSEPSATSEGGPGSGSSVNDLNPFERGPEITEVR